MRYNEFEDRIHPNGCTGIYSLRQYFFNLCHDMAQTLCIFAKTNIIWQINNN